MEPETAMEHYRHGRHVFNHEWAKAVMALMQRLAEVEAERDTLAARLTIAIGGQP